MKINHVFVIVTLMLLTSGCGLAGSEEAISPIVDAELPAVGKVGEVVSFNVHHTMYNGCGKYDRSETVEEGKTITVTVYGKYPKGKICSDDEPTLITVYHFLPKEQGAYYFRFYNGNLNGSEYLLDTLNVQ